MKNLFKLISIFFLLVLLPTFTFAQFTDPDLNPFGTPRTPSNPFDPPLSNTDAFDQNIRNQLPNSPTNLVGTTSSTSSCSPTITDIGDLLCKLGEILNAVVPVLVALGIVYFVFGVVQYVIANEEEAKKKGKERIIFGIIGLTVIVSLWGLVSIIVTTFGLEQSVVYTDLSSTLTQTSSLSCPSSLATGAKFQDLLRYITCIIGNSVIPLIFALATALFIWGVVQFVINSDETEKKAKGKEFMIWGIVALAVMISVWGLVSILTSTFGINPNFVPQVRPPGP